LLHPTEPVKIELHRHVVYTAWQALLPTEWAWQTARPHTVEGVAWSRLSPTAQAIHLLVHAQLAYYALAQPTLQLRQLLDLVTLRHHHEADIDWRIAWVRFQTVEQPDRMSAYLAAAQRLFDQPLPKEFSLSRSAAWQSWRLALIIQHPRITRQLKWQAHWLGRLGRLPRRLLTPSWYAMKLHALRRGEPWSLFKHR
jgi:hypothetical protein